MLKSFQKIKTPIIWEEIARDGAQAKTLLNAKERINIASNMCDLFTDNNAAQHLIFAAGYPSASSHEFDIVNALAKSGLDCSLATHGRATREDILLGIEALRPCQNGRVSFFIPVSQQFCAPMGFRNPQHALEHGLQILDFALEKVGVHQFKVDVAFADIARADPTFLTEAAQRFAESGVSIVKLCDSIGGLFPEQIADLVERVNLFFPESALLGVHQHNDLGLALAGTLQAMMRGASVLASSWLGLAERSGLPCTEQLLGLLGIYRHRFTSEKHILQWPDINLHALPTIARQVSDYTNVPLRSTDPFVGSGINSISTGTPFASPQIFHPYDPERVLGISQRIQATHLSGTKVIRTLAEQMGFKLSSKNLYKTVLWVKDYAYTTGRSVVPPEKLRAYLKTFSKP